MEKYQRFSSSFPATYMVFQWMHKTQSDLFGRYLGGMGGTEANAATGYGGGAEHIRASVQQPVPAPPLPFYCPTHYRTPAPLLVPRRPGWEPEGRQNTPALYHF